MTPKLLRVVRAIMNLTQAELAEKIGCTGQLIALIERRERRLTERMANRIMMALDLDELKLIELNTLCEEIVYGE